MPGAEEYFAHYSPRAIISTFTDAGSKFKAHYNLPSLNPFYYINPLYLRQQLNDPATLRNLFRLFIVIAAYFLLRPHLDTLLRKLSGAPDRREELIKARVAKMKAEERDTRKDK